MDHEPLIILAFSFHPLLSLSAVCRMQRQTFLKKELMLRKLSVKNDILNLSGIYFIFPLSYLARNPINFFIFYYLIFFWSFAERRIPFLHIRWNPSPKKT